MNRFITGTNLAVFAVGIYLYSKSYHFKSENRALKMQLMTSSAIIDAHESVRNINSPGLSDHTLQLMKELKDEEK